MGAFVPIKRRDNLTVWESLVMLVEWLCFAIVTIKKQDPVDCGESLIGPAHKPSWSLGWHLEPRYKQCSERQRSRRFGWWIPSSRYFIIYSFIKEYVSQEIKIEEIAQLNSNKKRQIEITRHIQAEEKGQEIIIMRYILMSTFQLFISFIIHYNIFQPTTILIK